MKEIPSYYWDFCIWIDLISRNKSDRVEGARHFFQLAQKKRIKLCISAMTLVEVCKDNPKHGDSLQLNGSEETTFKDCISRHVTVYSVSQSIGYTARNIQKKISILDKVGLADTIHVATCTYHNIHVLHTFDEDLISLNQKLECSDGKPLAICKPETPVKQLEITDIM